MTKSNIEFGPKLSGDATYDDALLLAFVAGDGWRLPTYDEWDVHEELSGYWFIDRPLYLKQANIPWIGTFNVRLVRDLKDD